MKRKILIVVYEFKMGGIAKSLINLCQFYKNSNFEVSLLPFFPFGELEKQVPPECKIIRHNHKGLMMLGFSQNDLKKRPFLYIKRAMLVIYSKLFGSDKYVTSVMKKINLLEEYDVAISFVHNGVQKGLHRGANAFVLSCVNSKQKIAVIHSDYASQGLSNRYNNEEYRKFDKVLTVSKETAKIAQEFIGMNVGYINNFCDGERIISLSQNPIVDLRESARVKFISVSRLTEEKGILRGVEAFSKIKQTNNEFVWYIVGDGPDKKLIQNAINKFNLSENVRLLGAKINPYPYIAKADYLLITSYHEAAPMVIEEALTLGKPVLSSEFSSAYSKINSENGRVFENSLEGIYKGLLSVMNEKLPNPTFDYVLYNKNCDFLFRNVIQSDKTK